MHERRNPHLQKGSDCIKLISKILIVKLIIILKKPIKCRLVITNNFQNRGLRNDIEIVCKKIKMSKRKDPIIEMSKEIRIQ